MTSTENSTATKIITSTATIVTQKIVVAATTTLVRTSTTPIDVEATVTVQRPLPRFGNFRVTLSGTLFWAQSQPNAARGDEAALLPFSGGQDVSDIYKQKASGQVIVDSSVTGPSVDGATLYYDPDAAVHGPNGGDGVISYLTAAPAGSVYIEDAIAANCSIDAKSLQMHLGYG